MGLKVSNKFIENITKNNGEYCLVSPYNSNNIIIQIDKQENHFQFLIFKYEIKQKQSHLKLIQLFNQDSEILISNEEKIKIWFIIPGRKYNEIIIFSNKLDLWSTIVSSENQLTSFQLMKKNFDFSDFEYSKDEFFYDIIPRDIFPYFINDEFIGISIFIENDCYVIINNIYENQSNLFQFTSEKEFFSEYNEKFYMFLFSIETGIVLIKSAETVFNNDYPLIIKVIDQYNLPLDIIVNNNCLYIIESNQIIKYQINNIFKNNIYYKFENKIINAGFFPSIPGLFILIEKENHFSLNYITFEFLENNNRFETNNLVKNFDLEIEFNSIKVIKLKNNHFGLIFDKKIIIFWSIPLKIEANFDNIIIKIQKLEKYNPLECLKFLEENYFELKNESKRVITQKKSYSREEDLFILEHIYDDLTLNEISAEIEHPRNSVYARFSVNYGTPSCNEHYIFNDSCIKCKNNLLIWKKEVKQKILNKDYNIRSYTDPELCRLYSKKERIIRSQTLHLRSRISAEIYDNNVKFLAQINCAGKSFSKLFVQSLRIFIGKKIAEIGIKNIKPSSFLSLFCEITPDLKILRELKKEYTNIVCKKPAIFSDKAFFFLKGINAIGELFEDDFFKLIKTLLINVLKLTNNPKTGFLPAIIYLLKDKKLTQSEICDAFKVTPVSLRKQIKNIKGNPKFLNLLREYKFQLKKL